MKPIKLPKQLPTFLVKAEWQATACYYKIIAKDPIDAKDRAWKQIAKTEGGDHCLMVKVIGEI